MSNRNNSRRVTIAPPTETIAPPTETIAPPTETIAPPTETIAPPTAFGSFLTVPIYFEAKGFNLYLSASRIYTLSGKPVAYIDRSLRVRAIDTAYKAVLSEIRATVASKVQALLYGKTPLELKALGLISYDTDDSEILEYQTAIAEQKQVRAAMLPKKSVSLHDQIKAIEKGRITKAAARATADKLLQSLGL